MWTQVMAWLRKTAPEEPPQQKIERLMNALRSSEPAARRNADIVVSRILTNPSDYEAEFIVSLLEAFAQLPHPEQLDMVPRSVLLIVNHGLVFGRPSAIQVAAQACLNHWEAQQEERNQAHILLRAAERPVNEDTLLRPASDAPTTPPERLLRASAPPDEED